MKRLVKFFWYTVLGGTLFVVLLFLLANWGVFGTMPSLKELENPSLLQTSEVYASDGTLMGKYYRENGNRSNVDYKDISKSIIDALVSTEDERFYTHSGIDFKSTLRAVVTLGNQGGGSTITQQLAKALLNQGRSGNPVKRVLEKIKEYIISVKLERNFTKEEILALYLNAVPYSDNVFGIRNASRTFFQKEPDRVNIEEAAMLVGMINGPGVYNPRTKPVNARDRRNLVITRMEEHNVITKDQADKARKAPIDMSHYRKLDENTGYAPYFREVLKNDVNAILKDMKKPDGSSYNIYDDGLKVYTTINIKMQQYAEEAMASWMPTLQRSLNSQSVMKTIWKGHEKELQSYMEQSDRWKNMKDEGISEDEIKKSFSVKVPMKVFAWNSNREKDTVMTPLDSIKYSRQMMQSSFIVTDPVTGDVKAWVGGISFKSFKYDHANLKTKRQVGSTIKPLLYCQAMEERGMSPESMVENSAQFFPGNGWVPAGRKCGGGQETMASALAYSHNCSSAYIMKQVGPQQFVDFLARINIPTKVEPFPSIALGSCDLSLYEMIWAYSIFAGHGFSTKPSFILRIEDRNGNVLKRFDNGVNKKEVVSEITAYKMCRMMQGTVDRGTAAGLRGRLGAAEMGGKTGTTNSNADFWFIGYTPQLLAGGWVGCDDRFITLGSSAYFGGTVARPVWEYFFKKVYADKSLGIEKDAKFSVPADMDNEIQSADFLNTIPTVDPGAQGDDQGAGSENDFITPEANSNDEGNEFIGPESKPAIDDNNNKVEKDTTTKKQKTTDPKIGEGEPPKQEKKKGLLNKIFGKKDN